MKLSLLESPEPKLADEPGYRLIYVIGKLAFIEEQREQHWARIATKAAFVNLIMDTRAKRQRSKPRC